MTTIDTNPAMAMEVDKEDKQAAMAIQEDFTHHINVENLL